MILMLMVSFSLSTLSLFTFFVLRRGGSKGSKEENSKKSREVGRVLLEWKRASLEKVTTGSVLVSTSFLIS